MMWGVEAMLDRTLNPWTTPFTLMGISEFAIKLILLVAIIFTVVKYYRLLKERNLYLLQIQEEIRKISEKVK